jgi:glycosyltransferase involved in cell wall biosynthesis
VSPGQEGLTSVDGLECVNSNHRAVGLLGNRLFWQYGMSLDPDMGHGDVLIVNGNLRILSNFSLMIHARRKRIGIVWWGHGSSKHPKRLMEALRWQIMRWVDAILLYTNAEVHNYIERGFPRHKLFATNNTIDLQPIDEAISYWTSKRLADFRSVHLLNKPFVVYCGRLKPDSRVDLALRAITKLWQQGKGCEMAIIGDGAIRNDLESLAATLGISNKLRWLGAIYDQRELAPWFLCADAFVYPGPIGLSLIHSMAYGLPVITHGNRQNHGPEIAALRDGENGLLFREGDVDSLAVALNSLLDRPAHRERLGAAAYRTARAEYSMDAMVDSFMQAVLYASRTAVRQPMGPMS